MLELGSLIGALSAGAFADRVSRQRAILIASGKMIATPCSSSKFNDLHLKLYFVSVRHYSLVRKASYISYWGVVSEVWASVH